MIHKKVIDDKTYIFHKSYSVPREAIVEAKRLRQKGYYARVVERSRRYGPWMVFKRKKSKKRKK